MSKHDKIDKQRQKKQNFQNKLDNSRHLQNSDTSYISVQRNFVSTIFSNCQNHGSIQGNQSNKSTIQWEATCIEGKFFLSDKQTISRYYQIQKLMTIQKDRLKKLKLLQQQNQNKQKQVHNSKDNKQQHQFPSQIVDSGLSQHSRILYQTIRSISQIYKKQDVQESLMSEGQKQSYMINISKGNKNQNDDPSAIIIKSNQSQKSNLIIIQNQNDNINENNIKGQKQVVNSERSDKAYIIGANGKKVYLKSMNKQEQNNISFVRTMTEADFEKLQQTAKKAKQTLQREQLAYNQNTNKASTLIQTQILLPINKNTKNLQNKMQQVFRQKKAISSKKRPSDVLNQDIQSRQDQSSEEEDSDIDMTNKQRALTNQEVINQFSKPQSKILAKSYQKLQTIAQRQNTDKSAQWSSINSNMLKNSDKNSQKSKIKSQKNVKLLQTKKKKIILLQTDREFLTSNQYISEDLKIHSRKKSNPTFQSRNKMQNLIQSKRKSGFIRTSKLYLQKIVYENSSVENSKQFNEQIQSLKTHSKSLLSNDHSQLQKQQKVNKCFLIKRRKSTEKSANKIQISNVNNQESFIKKQDLQKASIQSKKSGYLIKKMQVNLQKMAKYNQQSSNISNIKSEITIQKNDKNNHKQLNSQHFNKSSYLGKILQLSPNKTQNLDQSASVLQVRIHHLQKTIEKLLQKLNKQSKSSQSSKNLQTNPQIQEVKNINTKKQTIQQIINLDNLNKNELIDQIKRLKTSIRALQLQKIRSITIASEPRQIIDHNYKQTHIDIKRPKRHQNDSSQINNKRLNKPERQKLLQVLEKTKQKNQQQNKNQQKNIRSTLTYIGPFSQFRKVDQQNFISKIQHPVLPEAPFYQMGQQQLFNLSIEVYRLFGIQYNNTPYSMKDTKRQKLLVKKYKNCVLFDIIGKEKTIVWNFKGKQPKFYIGGWKSNDDKLNGTKNGNGLQITDKYAYEGQFQKGKKHGKGKIQYQNQTIFEGQFVQNKKSGFGKQFNSFKNQFYIGEFKNNERNGSGSLKIADKGFYKGLFEKDLKQGYGHQILQNGDQYKGEYVNNLTHGKGTYFWKNGSSYEGQFQNGQRHGYGKWTSAPIQDTSQRDTYVGLYKNDRKQGQGKYTWRNGYFYQGQFLNDLGHGKGTLVYQNRIIQGTWKNGQIINNEFGFIKKYFQDEHTMYQSQYEGVY